MLPDELVTVDNSAFRIAKKVFPGVPIVRENDFYKRKQIKQIQKISSLTPNNLLYLTEPIRCRWLKKVKGEFQALNYFFENIKNLNLPADAKVLIRLHPSEKNDKYNKLLRNKGQVKILPKKSNLYDNISQSRWIAGCQTYAMVLGLESGRDVFCSLPPWAPNSALPHKKIVYIKEIK